LPCRRPLSVRPVCLLTAALVEPDASRAADQILSAGRLQSTENECEQSVTRLALGQTYITPGAEAALQSAGQTAIEFLRRHMSCDWGELSDDDIRENGLWLKKGFRLLSNYRTAKGQQLWTITEADRSATTVLLPSEH
jgi:hypothetical protein